jgi:hypothetical protein
MVARMFIQEQLTQVVSDPGGQVMPASPVACTVVLMCPWSLLGIPYHDRTENRSPPEARGAAQLPRDDHANSATGRSLPISGWQEKDTTRELGPPSMVIP